MCPYLSLSHHNPNIVIQSNNYTSWSRCQFSCRPTLVYTLSTSRCGYAWSAGCFLAFRVRGRYLFILCNTCMLYNFSSFLCVVPTPNCAAVLPPGCGSFSYWGGGGGGGGGSWGRQVGVAVSVFSFFLRCPLRGAGPSLSMIVAEFALFLSLSYW